MLNINFGIRYRGITVLAQAINLLWETQQYQKTIQSLSAFSKFVSHIFKLLRNNNNNIYCFNSQRSPTLFSLPKINHFKSGLLPLSNRTEYQQSYNLCVRYAKVRRRQITPSVSHTKTRLLVLPNRLFKNVMVEMYYLGSQVYYIGQIMFVI